MIQAVTKATHAHLEWSFFKLFICVSPMCLKTWHLFTWIVSLSWRFIFIPAAVPPTQASTSYYTWTTNQMLWVFKPLAGFGTSLPASPSPHASSPFMNSKNHLPQIPFSYCHCPVLCCLSVLNVGSDFSPNLMELKPLLWLSLSTVTHPNIWCFPPTSQAQIIFLIPRQVLLRSALHLGLRCDFSRNTFSCCLLFVEMCLWIHHWPPPFLPLWDPLPIL